MTTPTPYRVVSNTAVFDAIAEGRTSRLVTIELHDGELKAQQRLQIRLTDSDLTVDVMLTSVQRGPISKLTSLWEDNDDACNCAVERVVEQHWWARHLDMAVIEFQAETRTSPG